VVEQQKSRSDLDRHGLDFLSGWRGDVFGAVFVEGELAFVLDSVVDRWLHLKVTIAAGL
jgi:hypothetical protein